MSGYLGIDIGSVATKIVLLRNQNEIISTQCLRTLADPIDAVRIGLSNLIPSKIEVEDIEGVGVTGSAKELAAIVLNADVVKNEISSNAMAVKTLYPKVNTIIEIGGQDSKIIFLRNGSIYDFTMNAVCAAGTGSFLEQQANRLGITISELSELAIRSTQNINIAARCTVFAESDMIYKQQIGWAREDILYGLCLSLARNYLNTLAKGKKVSAPICFQGGVAANKGMRKAFTELLGVDLVIPTHFMYMGAIGAALHTINQKEIYGKTSFSSDILKSNLLVEPFVCNGCENRCHVLKYLKNAEVLGYKGDICGKFSLQIHPDVSQYPKISQGERTRLLRRMKEVPLDERGNVGDFDQNWINYQKPIVDFIESNEFKEQFRESIPQLEDVYREFGRGEISALEYCAKCFKIISNRMEIYLV